MVSLENVVWSGKVFNDLGWAVQAQLESLLHGDTEPENYNRNALFLIKEYLDDIEFMIKDTDTLVDAQELLKDLLANDEVTGG
jgi:hypothetical protein